MLRILPVWVFVQILIGAIGSAAGYYVGGDAIGLDNSATSNTGGFTAVQTADSNLGQPAILIALNGQELMTELRVIVFGVAAGSVGPRFDEFDYRLDIWPAAEYFENLPARYQVDLGVPVGVENFATGPTSVVPAIPFGNAGAAGYYALTYDFRFDLTGLTGGASSQVLGAPLPAGEWVFGFQSWHNPATSGYLRVAGSVATAGPIPLFGRDSIPRGVLGSQDPNNLSLRWGMSLAAVPVSSRENLSGDFNGNSLVDAADYVLWRKMLGQGTDVQDYELWRGTFGLVLSQTSAGKVNTGSFVDAADDVLWHGIVSASSDDMRYSAGNESNRFDDADYWKWYEEFQISAIESPSTPVPEHSALIQLSCSLILIVLSRSWNSRSR